MTIEPKRRRPSARNARTALRDQDQPSKRRRAATTATPAETAAAAPEPKAPDGKLGTLVELMSREAGATMDELVQATGWQAHSIRGAMAGALKRNRGYEIGSTKAEGVRTYRIIGRNEAEAG